MIHPSATDDDLRTPFEKGNGNQTTTYEECIAWYKLLDQKFESAKLFEYGTTSIGKPLHLLVISKDNVFDPETIRKNNKRIYLINNGIHPGEPDGIDASMMLARDLLIKEDLNKILDHVVVIIIPAYNISGMLNRSAYSRANQNGPEAYGFRGTAQQYDLNRDFVKCDSREAQTFTEIFRTWQPEIFVDTHVSNGADYQYTMTLIPTQPDKLQPLLASYQEKILLPDLYESMKQQGFEITPYVDPVGVMPDSGIVQFLETPRYSTGYAALFNCISMMPETHMLKPYASRVQSTYCLLATVGQLTNRDYLQIGNNKKKADEAIAAQQQFALNWKLDESKFDTILFKGFTGGFETSKVSGLPRLHYYRDQPFAKDIKYFNHYVAGDVVSIPFGYLIPQAWDRAIERLKANGVVMKRLSRDTLLKVEVYYIEDYKTTSSAFEGHYLHSAIKVRKAIQELQCYRGDYVVIPDQAANRYIVEMLEPQATDSYFAWNFFDAILMQKEYFSDYVFEDLAADLLSKEDGLRKEFESVRKTDPDFAANAKAQLNWIYRHSPYFEKSYLRYPVARLTEPAQLPVDETDGQ